MWNFEPLSKIFNTLSAADYTVSTDPCLPDPCNGRGTCTGGTCTCFPGWTGTHCDQIGNNSKCFLKVIHVWFLCETLMNDKL